MKRLRSLLSKKGVFAVLLAVSIGILAFSGVQTSRAALTYVSQNYTAEVTVSNIGLTLVENGHNISWRDYSNGEWNETSGALLEDLLAEGEDFQIGRSYPETLRVTNSGSIDEYVRVILYRYWEGPDGKETDLSPELIELELEDNGWVIDESASTKERLVLYYSSPLAVGESTPSLCKSICINGSLANEVTETRTTDENGYTLISRTFDYNGVKFMLEAEADGVQTHNAADAIKSAWGVDVTISEDGSLSVNG